MVIPPCKNSRKRHVYGPDGICVFCGFKRLTSAEYQKIWNGWDHNKITDCVGGYTNHRYENGKCIRCGAKEPTKKERHAKWRQQFKKEKKP